MRILIINPNSDPQMTADIHRSARIFAGDRFQVETLRTPGAPKFIDTYLDTALAVPGMLRLIREHETHYDAFVIACHCDPNLDLCKEVTTKPVVGIGEASMKIASMLGHRFSVLSTSPDSVPNKQALIYRYGLDSSLASVHAPKTPAHALDDLELFLQLGREAMQNDGAEVLVLGCAGLCELSETLQAQLGVPVLDGVVCGLIIAEGLARAHYTTSKICRYKGNNA